MDIRVISTVLMAASVHGECVSPRVDEEVSEVHVVRSPVAMPAVMGDPARADALSAVLALAGVEDVVSFRLRQVGHYKLRKKIGPFESMELKRFWRPTSASPDCGDEIEQVTMIAQCRGGHQAEHVGVLRSVRDLLQRGIPSVRFVESMSGNGFCLEEKASGPVAGNWTIRLSLVRHAPDLYVYRFEMVRKASRLTRAPQSIDIDVDI